MPNRRILWRNILSSPASEQLNTSKDPGENRGRKAIPGAPVFGVSQTSREKWRGVNCYTLISNGVEHHKLKNNTYLFSSNDHCKYTGMHRRACLYRNTCSPSPYRDIACLGCLFIPPPRDFRLSAASLRTTSTTASSCDAAILPDSIHLGLLNDSLRIVIAMNCRY